MKLYGREIAREFIQLREGIYGLFLRGKIYKDTTVQIKQKKHTITKLWQLKLPSKIKINLWKITNDYLPILKNIVHRRLREEALCPVCNEEDKTKIGIMPSNDNIHQEWKQWLVQFFRDNSPKQCTNLTIIVRAIWYNKNKLYHEGVKDIVQDVKGFIKAYKA